MGDLLFVGNFLFVFFFDLVRFGRIECWTGFGTARSSPTADDAGKEDFVGKLSSGVNSILLSDTAAGIL